MRRHSAKGYALFKCASVALVVSLLMVAICLAAVPTVSGAQEDVIWSLQGQVFEGSVGDKSRPLKGVTIIPRAAWEPYPDEGFELARTQTDEGGSYVLEILASYAEQEYPYYSAYAINLPGYGSVGAMSAAGWVPTSDWSFQGRVYEGEVGDESRPLAGVSVAVYGANNPYPDPGVLIRSSTTNAEGWYGLTVYDDDGPWEFYHIRETNPRGYTSVGATTVDGTVRTDDWIEYVIPLDRKVLTGNKFWDRAPLPPPESGPDLSIVAADQWEVSEDGRRLVLYIVVANKGDVQARKTAAQASDPETGWESAMSPVPPLEPGDDTTVPIELEIPEDQRGFDHVFLVQVDSGQWVTDESNRDNNERWTPPIYIPELPVGEEPYVEGIEPDRGRPGEEMMVTIYGHNFTPEFDIGIPDLVEVHSVEFLSPGELLARIAIHPEAPPGTRPVWVGIQDGPAAVLEDGFTVLEPEREGPPDLTVTVSDWEIDRERTLVLHLMVRNIGDGYAGETIVRAEEPDTGWASEFFGVPEMAPGDSSPVEIAMQIPDEQRGRTHRFDITVDPEDWIAESNERNNTTSTDAIPVPPSGEVGRPTEPRPIRTPAPDEDRGGLDPRVLILVLGGGLLGGGAFLLRGRGRGGRRGPGERRPGALGKPETYYYVSGVPVSIRRRDDLIAVKFKGIDSHTAAARAGAGSDVPGFRPPMAQDLWPGGQVLLRQLPGETRSPEQQEALFRALNQRADVEHASFVYELNPDDTWIATDRLIAQFRTDMSEAEIGALNRQYGVEEVERIPWLPSAYLLRVTPASPGDALAIANAYAEEKHAVFAHPNFLRQYAHRTPVLQPDAATPERYWHLDAIEAFEAWQISSGSPDVVVAIIDDGADVDHAAFASQVGEHFNVVDRSGDPRPPEDKPKEYAHGTACAGLAVGASNQAIGTSGVAPGCRLMAIRALDRVIPVTVEQKLVEALTEAEKKPLREALSVVEPYREGNAIQWASEHGADVISNSWGPPDGYAESGKTFPIDDYPRLALTTAAESGRDGKGCVICWAAGNGNESISFDGYATRPEVLAVGACTLEGKRAPYSDYGPEVDISAPGGGYTEGLLTTVDVDLEAHQAYRHDFNGTSAAAPVVAGVAALVLSVNSDLTREEVYEILRDTADKIDLEGGQYDERGHSPFYGWGRVNARRALQRAAET